MEMTLFELTVYVVIISFIVSVIVAHLLFWSIYDRLNGPRVKLKRLTMWQKRELRQWKLKNDAGNDEYWDVSDLAFYIHGYEPPQTGSMTEKQRLSGPVNFTTATLRAAMDDGGIPKDGWYNIKNSVSDTPHRLVKLEAVLKYLKEHGLRMGPLAKHWSLRPN